MPGKRFLRRGGARARCGRTTIWIKFFFFEHFLCWIYCGAWAQYCALITADALWAPLSLRMCSKETRGWYAESVTIFKTRHGISNRDLFTQEALKLKQKRIHPRQRIGETIKRRRKTQISRTARKHRVGGGVQHARSAVVSYNSPCQP